MDVRVYLSAFFGALAAIVVARMFLGEEPRHFYVVSPQRADPPLESKAPAPTE